MNVKTNMILHSLYHYHSDALEHSVKTCDCSKSKVKTCHGCRQFPEIKVKKKLWGKKKSIYIPLLLHIFCSNKGLFPPYVVHSHTDPFISRLRSGSLSKLKLKKVLVTGVAWCCRHKNTQLLCSLNGLDSYEIVWNISFLCGLMIMPPDNAGFTRGND